MRLPPPDQRCGKPAAAAAVRIGLSLLRGRVTRLATARVRLPQGVLVKADLRTTLGLRLYRYGFCEPEADLLGALLERDDVFIDGGANVGLYSLVAAARVGPRGRVLACEPATGTMDLLRANVDVNGFDWVEPRRVALAEEPGTLTLFTFGAGAGVSSFAPESKAGSAAEEVPVATLDDVAGDDLERVRLVKLDVEGAELRALRGARRLIESARPSFLIEIEPAHLERQGASVDEVRALLEDAGYEAFRVGRDEDGVFVSRLDTDWASQDGGPNVLAMAADRDHAHDLRVVP